MIEPELKEILLKLVISVLIGAILGGEREYRNKSAGLRTIILICLGSTLFTILSLKIGDETGASRVAANIVTGIGFIGAGAIMREGLSISGMTTASTIWVAAALGMAVGVGEFALAFYAMIIAFLVLTAFSYLQRFLVLLTKTIELHLTLDSGKNEIKDVEREMDKLKLKFLRRKEFRKDDRALYQYDVIGKEKNISALVAYLSKSQSVRSFDY
jgi:putative Mg2+ transporter-C (MgtC) family protein